MLIALYAGAWGVVFHFSRNVQLQEHWAYSSGGHGHARRHESVWIVPGMAEG